MIYPVDSVIQPLNNRAQEAKQYTENLNAKLQIKTQIKTLAFPGLA